MKIYIDVLMLTNAIIAMVLVRCTARLTHERLRLRRELSAGAAGAVFSLLAALSSTGFFTALLITLGKGAAMLVITAAAFRPKSARALFRRAAVYLIFELGFGGACLMIVGLTGRRVLCIRNYVVYFDISLLQLAVCCAAVYLIAVTADTLRRRRSENIGRYRAVFRMGNFVKELPAFSDTGNLLRDSFTGAPVMIFRSDELYRRFDLDCPEHLYFYGFHPVPYDTINGCGLISVTSRADISIKTESGLEQVECCAGILPSAGRKDHAIFDPIILE
ncbi:MAG: sigma-E processing peptidase SpoIIGA [Ruminococcus sp.]|nr:sigma-E processing peptidase SpoIIGA [Ruminococcus sp.]